MISEAGGICMFREIKSYRTGKIRFKIFCLILIVVISMVGASALRPTQRNTGSNEGNGKTPILSPVEATDIVELPGYSMEVFDLSLPEGSQTTGIIEVQVPVNEEKLALGVSTQECLTVAVYKEDAKTWEPVPFVVEEETKIVTAFIDRAVRLGVAYFPQERSAIKHRLPEFDGLGGALFSNDPAIPWATGWEILKFHYGMPEFSSSMLSGIPDRDAVSRVELLLTEVDIALDNASRVKGSLMVGSGDQESEAQEKKLCFAEATKLDAVLLALKKELNKEYTITVDLDFYDRVDDLSATKASLRNKQGEISQSVSFDANGKAIFTLSLFEFLKAGGPTEVAVLVPAHPGYKEFKATLSYRLASSQIQLRAPYLTPSQKR
jgi:hypothetical protein